MGVDSRMWWEYQPGQHVMTREGFPGTVTAVSDGPAPGNEEYIVTLDNAMGGGRYSSSELSPLPQTTSQVAVVDHTAATDYPELGDILIRRPDHQTVVHSAGLQATASFEVAAAATVSIHPEFGYRYAPISDNFWEKHNRDRSQDRIDKAFRAGEPWCAVCGAALNPETKQSVHIIHGGGDAVHPEDIDKWRVSNDNGDMGEWDLGPECAKLVPAAMRSKPGKTAGLFDFLRGSGTPQGDFAGAGHNLSFNDWCRFRKNSRCFYPKTLNKDASKQMGYAVWVPEDRGYCPRLNQQEQANCPVGEPGPNAQGPTHYTDATVAFEDGGQRGGTPAPFYNPTPLPSHPNTPGAPSTFASPFAASLQTVAAWEPELGFHFTATWAEVRAKAKEIARSGGVRILATPQQSANMSVTAQVKGDTNVYLVGLTRVPGRQAIALWECGCAWASYAWGRTGRWKKFEGRMCSHALALNYEAQKRGMFGKTVLPDHGQPIWMDPTIPVKEWGDWDRSKGRYSALVGHQPGEIVTVDGKPGYKVSEVEADGVVRVWEPGQFNSPHTVTVNPNRINKQAMKVISSVAEDDPPPVVEMVKAALSEGCDPNDALRMLVVMGAENPSALFALALGGTFMAKVRGIVQRVFLGRDGSLTTENGNLLQPEEVLYPTYDPQLGLRISDQKIATSDTKKVRASRVEVGMLLVLPGGEVTRVSSVSHKDHYGISGSMPVTEMIFMFEDGGRFSTSVGDWMIVKREDKTGARARVAPEDHYVGLTQHVGGIHAVHPEEYHDENDGFAKARCGAWVSVEHTDEGPMRYGDPENYQEEPSCQRCQRSLASKNGSVGPGQPDTCPCCNGTGEHICGHECYSCDATGSAKEAHGQVCEGHRGRPDYDRGLDYGGSLGNGYQHDIDYHMLRAASVDCPAPEHHGESGVNPLRLDEDGSYTHVDGSISHDDGTCVSDWIRPTAAADGLSASQRSWLEAISQENKTFSASDYQYGGSYRTIQVLRDKGHVDIDGEGNLRATDAGRDFLSKSAAKKDEGPTVSGVALKAADTGRILMLQRGIGDEKDPARGTWEFPGGHHEDGDTTSLHAGIREWQEEVGQKFPEGGYVAHTWQSPDGVYQGHVVVIPEEKAVCLHQGRDLDNPDDPDGDESEQVAWWDPDDAKKNPALREECKTSPWKTMKAAALTRTATWASSRKNLAEDGKMFDRCPTCRSEADKPCKSTKGAFMPYVHNGRPTCRKTDENQKFPFSKHVGAETDLHDKPEPALPTTDGEKPDGADTGLVPGEFETVAPDASDDDGEWATYNYGPDNFGFAYEPPPNFQDPLDYDDYDLPDVTEVAPATFDDSLVTDQGWYDGDPDHPKSVRASADPETLLQQHYAAMASGDVSASPFAHLAAPDKTPDNDMAAAAQEFLAKQGVKTFTPAERKALIDEGLEDGVTASNLDRLDITGTHYEALDRVRASRDDEDPETANFMMWA